MQPFPSVEHEDAFLLFRALCKLSQRPDHAGPGDGLAVAPTAEEARQMESKAVSLVSEARTDGLREGGLRRWRRRRWRQLRVFCFVLFCSKID